jgi:acyl carrier protein
LESGTSTSSTLERIQGVVRALLGNNDIVLTPETRPADVPGWDSLANVNIVFGVEEEFGIRFSDEDLAAAPTVGEFAERVNRLTA